jgi:uncharacterized membrane protein
MGVWVLVDVNQTFREIVTLQTQLGPHTTSWQEYLILVGVLVVLIYLANRYDLYALEAKVKEKMIKGLKRFRK